MTLRARLRDRFTGPPEPVRAALDNAERVLGWGELVGEGWLVATTAGLRRVPDGELLRWHEVGTATWAAAGAGGRLTVVPLAEVEPGVQARRSPVVHALAVAGSLPGEVRGQVERTVVTSRRHPLPGGGAVLLVARRVPGRAGREWSVVFDSDADRDDPGARDVARARLAEAVAGDDPSS